jgi:hypothetical protein
MRQIIESGRLRQAELLAAAERERRALATADTTADQAVAVERSIGLWTRFDRARLPGVRVFAILGALVQIHGSHS